MIKVNVVTKKKLLVSIISMASLYLSNISCRPLRPQQDPSENDSLELGKNQQSKGRSRRGVWITSVNSNVYDSRENIRTHLQKLKALGFNTIYPVVSNKGMTIFPSKISALKLGISIDPRYRGRNVLRELTEEAAQVGLIVIPWLESGLKVPFSVTRRVEGKPVTQNYPIANQAKTRGWLLPLANGAHKKDDYINNASWGFLDPTNPEVVNYFQELVIEIISQRGVAGIMLDDHFSIDPEFEAGKKYKNDALQWCKEVSCKGSDSEKIERYSVEKIISLVSAISKTVHSGAEGGRQWKALILAPGGGQNFTRNGSRQDWHEIARRGLVDEIIIQTYRYSLASFLQEIAKMELRRVRQSYQRPVGVAILAGIGNNNDPKKSVSGNLLYQQVRAARKAGYDISFFYSDSLFRPALAQQESMEERQCWIDSLFKDNAPCKNLKTKPEPPELPHENSESETDPALDTGFYEIEPDQTDFDPSPIILDDPLEQKPPENPKVDSSAAGT